ncbi:MAG: hypothetical protein GQ552_03405 [Flavobacteriaceae bacterium]|nr:hypothetical protein [Flavobacteriaceae bacterium]
MVRLLLIIHSCRKDEFRTEFNSNLKSVELKENELIEEAQNWVENNPDKNQFTLLKSADKLKWNKAIINDLDSVLVIEVPVMLKSQHKVHVVGNDKLIIEHRLLIFKEKDSIYSLMEYFISEKELEYLQDTEKIKYSKKEDDFEGTIVLVDNCNEVVSTEVISKKVKSAKISLKAAESYCVYAEDSCYTGGGGGSSSSDSNTEASENCGCNICNTCWGCTDEPIFNNETNSDIPEGDALEDNYDCPACICPAIDWDDIITNEKAFCIFQNLIKTGTNEYNSLVLSFILAFSGNEPYHDIVFEVGNLDGVYGNFDGTVYPPVITLNSETISNRAPIEIAKTLMHEMLHAFISQDGMLTSSSFVNNFEEYLKKNDKGIYIDHHEMMYDHYVDPMVKFLKDFDKVSGQIEDDAYYRGLAISGLQNVVGFTLDELKSITQSETFFRNRGLNCD